MSTCHEIEPRLSELLDGGLSEAERQACDEHLAGCAACRGVLQDLQRLRRSAAALGPIAPPDHVWLQVVGQARLDRSPAAPSARHHRPAPAALGQWAALAAALAAVTLGAHLFLRSTPAPEAGDRSNATATGSVQAIAEELTLAMEHYERAIAELEALASANSDALDADMADTLRKNILTVNAAIEESRAALLQNPGNEPARVSLFEALNRKFVVLQATVNLMNEMRKGNPVGAGEAAASLGKKS